MKTAQILWNFVKKAGMGVCIASLAVTLTACYVNDDDCDDCGDYHRGGWGDVEGRAYFPYESGHGEYPVYYDTGNFDIHVTLYDSSGHFIGEDITGDDGFYLFTDVPPGNYYVTARIDLYNPDKHGYDIFEADSYDFYVGYDQIMIVDLYLDYSGHSHVSPPLKEFRSAERIEHGFPEARVNRNKIQPSA